MSQRQTALDEVVEDLREFEAGDTVTLVTDAGSITARVTDTRWEADGVKVTLADHDSDRRVRVSTEWYGGWLDPLVDAHPALADAGDGGDDGDFAPDVGRPVGTLVDVRLVAAGADQPRQRGRP